MARPSKATETYGIVHLRPRGSRWRVYWTEGGRDRERSAPDLEAARRIALAEAARIGLPGAAMQPTVRWGELASAWLAADHPTWGSKQRGKMRTSLRTHLVPALGTRPCDELGPQVFQLVLQGIADQGYSSSTLDGCMQVLRGVAIHGRQLGVWGQTEDPMVGVRSPRPAQDPFRTVEAEEVPTPAQVTALASAMTRPQDGLMVRFAAGTGLRWGELVGLRVARIDLEARSVQVRTQVGEDDEGRLEERAPKTKAGLRSAPIPAGLAEELAAHLAGKDPDDLVFPAPRGGRLRRSNWNRRSWRPAHTAAGWPEELTFHNLRHFSATDWLARDLDDEDVARALGHSSSRFTRARYAGADADYVSRMTQVL